MDGEIVHYECYRECVNKIGCTLISSCVYFHPVLDEKFYLIHNEINKKGEVPLRKIVKILEELKPPKVTRRQGYLANKKERQEASLQKSTRYQLISQKKIPKTYSFSEITTAKDLVIIEREKFNIEKWKQEPEPNFHCE